MSQRRNRRLCSGTLRSCHSPSWPRLTRRIYPMRPASFVLVLWMMAACSTSPPGQPADAVKRFFEAVAAGDCNAATGTLSQASRAELKKKNLPCDEYIKTWRPFQLERVIETQVDGRNQEAHL